MKTYIYCTKAKPNLYLPSEFEVFPNDEASQPYFANEPIIKEIDRLLNGTVCVECDIDEVDEINIYKKHSTTWVESDTLTELELEEKSCLEWWEIEDYLGGKNGYALHLKNVKPVDLELSDFEYYETKLKNTLFPLKTLKKAPQSYQYAYYKGERVLILSVQSKWVCKILNGEKTVEIRKLIPKELKGERK